MSKEMVATIIKTFSAEVSCVTVRTSGVIGDLFLIGSNGELELGHVAFLARLADPEIDADLERISMNDTSLLVRTFKFGPLGVREFLAEFPADLPLNTDAHPIVEFGAPRFLLEPRIARNFNQRSDLTGNLSRLLELIAFERNADRLASARTAQHNIPGGSPDAVPVTP
jgi:hypothetical protein